MEKINEVREEMEKDKKVKLVIDVAKNIVEQYREQLKNNIEEKKNMNLDEYAEENYVIRAEKALGFVDKILDNFEESVFDGELIDGAFHLVVYDVRRNKKYVSSSFGTLLENVQAGVKRVFEQIGIPEYSIYPIILDIMERTKDKNYVNGNLDERMIGNKYFNTDGKYKVGELNINNLLGTQMIDNRLTYFLGFPGIPALYSQDSDFCLDVHEIKNIIDSYIKEELIERNLESLKDQNKFVNDTFKLVRLVGTYGGYNNEITKYCVEQFNSIYANYYKTARTFNVKQEVDVPDSKKELQLLKEQAEKLKESEQMINIEYPKPIEDFEYEYFEYPEPTGVGYDDFEDDYDVPKSM